MKDLEVRRFLDRVLDELIPPGPDGHIPGAGSAGVAEFFESAGRYVQDDPAIAVSRVVACVAEKCEDFAALDRSERVAIIAEVEREVPEAFTTLLRLTYMGYYSRPDLRPHFGLSAGPTHPDGYRVAREPASWLAELTAPVRARGPVYRRS